MKRLATDPTIPTSKSKLSAVSIANKYRNMGLNARVIPNQRGFNVYVGKPRMYNARRGFIDGRGPEPRVGLSTLGRSYRDNKTPPMMNFNGYPIKYSNKENIPSGLRGKEALIHDMSFGGIMGQEPMSKSRVKEFFDIRQLDDGDYLISEPVIRFDDEQKTWIIDKLGEKAQLFIDPQYSPPTVSFTGEVKFDRNISKRERNQFTKAITGGSINLEENGIEDWLEVRLKAYKGYDFTASLRTNAEKMLGSKNWEKVKIQIENNTADNVFLETMLEIAKGKRKWNGFTGTKPIAQTEIGIPYVGYVPEWKLLGPAVEEVDVWIMGLEGYDPKLNLRDNIRTLGGDSANEALMDLFDESKRFRSKLPKGPGEGNKTYNRGKKEKLPANSEEIDDDLWAIRDEMERETMEMIDWNSGFVEMSEIEREELLDEMYEQIDAAGLADMSPEGVNDEYQDGKFKSEVVKDLKYALSVDPQTFKDKNFKNRQNPSSFGQFAFLNDKGSGLYSPLNRDMVDLLSKGQAGIDGSDLITYVENKEIPQQGTLRQLENGDLVLENLMSPSEYATSKINPNEVFYGTNKQYLNWMNEIGKQLSKKVESDPQKQKLKNLFEQLQGAIEFYDTRDLDSTIINQIVMEKLKKDDLLKAINWQYVLSIRDSQDPFGQLNPALEPRRKRVDNRIINLEEMIQNNDDIDGEDRFAETIDYANKLTELLDSDVEWIARGEQRNVFRPIPGKEGNIGKGNVLKINRHLFIGDDQKNHPSVKGIKSDVLTAQDTGFWEDYTTKRISALGKNDWGEYTDLIVPAKTAGPGAVIQRDSEKELLESYKRYAETGNWSSEIEMWREKTDPELKNWAMEQDLGEANFGFFSDDYVYRLLDFYAIGLPNEYIRDDQVRPANAGVNSQFRKVMLDQVGASTEQRQKAMDEAMNSLDEKSFLRSNNQFRKSNEYVLDEIDRMLEKKGIDPVGMDGIYVDERRNSNE
jgi:hypothetical protein